MGKYASEVVRLAVSWLGMNEADGTHKRIIDIYNAHKPLARGYAVKYTDAWCAATVSAVAIKLGYTDIIPTECSCNRMIELCKKMGIFVENDSRTPAPGDILFYDWDDNGKGDNLGSADHVGIVEKVSGGKITVVEGNYSNAVKRRTLAVDGRYIRGYACPKYDKEPTTDSTNASAVTVSLSTLRNGVKGAQVKTLQRILYAMGYNLGASKVDGDFGAKTETAVRTYQTQNGLTADGVVGQSTWDKLLKG